MHVRLVLEGSLASLYVMVWAMCMCSVRVIAPFVVPSVASEFAIFMSYYSCGSSYFLDDDVVLEPCYTLYFGCY